MDLNKQENGCTSLDSNDNNDNKDTENTDQSLINGNMKCLDKYVHGNQIVRLNVGGVKYMTRISTLTNFHDLHPHALGAMFSGQYLLKPDTNENEYFIDRDGEYFKHILYILRCGPQIFISKILPILAADTIVYLQEEINYFGLYNLVFGTNKFKHKLVLQSLTSQHVQPIYWKTDWYSNSLCSNKLIVTQHGTLLSDPIPDEIWCNKTPHYTEFVLEPLEQRNDVKYLSNAKSNSTMCSIEMKNTYEGTSYCYVSLDDMFDSIPIKDASGLFKFGVAVNPIKCYLEVNNDYINSKHKQSRKGFFRNMPIVKSQLRLQICIRYLKQNTCLAFESLSG